MTWKIDQGDCREILPKVEAESVDAIVTDPPYEIGFMGKQWDSSGIAYQPAVWGEVLRVLKPGGYLLAFGAPRTYHRLTCAIEDAGFEIRDSIHWIYGSGFPKSRDVSKAIDARPGVASHAEFARHLAKAREATGLSRADVSERVVGTRSGACWNWEHHQFPEFRPWLKIKKCLPNLDIRWGQILEEAEREITGKLNLPTSDSSWFGAESNDNITAPSTAAAKQWEGWGTALKPAHEPIVVARKPFSSTVAANIQRHGTGAINVEGCRVGTGSVSGGGNNFNAWRSGEKRGDRPRVHGIPTEGYDNGRWPPNVCLSPEAAAEMDRQSGKSFSSGGTGIASKQIDKRHKWRPSNSGGFGDTGGASRYFPVFRYEAKASQSERNAGLPDGMENTHPTVKPVALMQWLCRLVTQPGGTVLDPFVGSGSTGIAAVREGFDFVGIEEGKETARLATLRIEGDAPLFNRR